MSLFHSEILPECYADTLLVEILKYNKPTHCFGIGEVPRIMQNIRKKQLSIGVTDKDKPGTIPIYLMEFVPLTSNGGLELQWHPDTKHFLIVVAPALEQWLLDTAEDLGVDAAKYGFKDLKALKRITKHENAGKNQNLKNFLNALKQKKGSPLQEMVKWIDLVLEEKGGIEKVKVGLGLEG